MESEAKMIAEAILQLKQEESTVKDFLYPVFSMFFSAMAGGLIAFLLFKYQEHVKLHRERMDIINNWVLSCQEAFQGLMTVKGLYRLRLGSNPIQRTFAIPEVVKKLDKLDLNVAELSFLHSTGDESELFSSKWKSTQKIGAMVKNFNLAVDAWEARKVLSSEILPELAKHNGSESATVNVDLDEIDRIVGRPKFIKYISLSEYSLKVTDEILIELVDFITTFKDTARFYVDTQRVGKYGYILRWDVGNNNELSDLLKRCPEVDYGFLSNYSSLPEERLRLELCTPYDENEDRIPQDDSDEISKKIKEYKIEAHINRKYRCFWR